jgi:hypothetical protein
MGSSASTDSTKTMPHANQSAAANTGKDSMPTWIKLLIIYFCTLILVSLIAAVMIWKPTSQSSGTNTTQFIIYRSSLPKKYPSTYSATTSTPNTTKTTTVNSNGTTITNITSYIIGNNQKKVAIIISSIPSSLGKEKEDRLIELSLLFGVVGSSVYAVTSLTIWQSRNKLVRSFYSWYLTRPLIGAALAVTVYLLLRSTLLTTVVNGSQIGGIAFISDYGVAGVSALVGLMTAQVTTKLRDVFDTMFGIQKGTDKGEIDVVEDNITLTPKDLTLNKDMQSVLVAVVKDNSNKPVTNKEVEFAIVDSGIVKPCDGAKQTTDTNGMAVLRIDGIKEGNTKVHAMTEIDEGKPVYTSSTVKVTKVAGKGEDSTEKNPSNTGS